MKSTLEGCQHDFTCRITIQLSEILGNILMSSTYISLHFHVVFSTKNRECLILPEWQSELHEYIGGTINGLGGRSQIAGGVADHVHLLFGLKSTHCLADVVREIKKASCNWVHDVKGLKNFYWQTGYSAFTVSPTARGGVHGYIANQESHHARKSFRDELKELLVLAEIDFEEEYLD